MSSHELLELFGARVVEDAETRTRTVFVDFPPENGAVAKVLRGGERSELEQMVAQTANELAVLRAAYVPNAQADQYDSRFFLTAARRREYHAEREQLRAEREQARDGDFDDDSMAAMWHQKEVS